ncbi:MAG: hypothetical protein IJX76_03985 [Clostridia bacterium]|nr:hypothetical protein [Clostridia bacterium]
MKLYYFTFCLSHIAYTPDENRYYGRILRNESAYLTEYMLRALNTEFKFDCRRINIMCCGEGYVRPKVIESDHVLLLDVLFDIKYFSMTSKEKEQYLFGLLTSSLKKICEFKKWDFSIFEKHLNNLESNGFKVDFYVESKGLCRNGDTVAKIYAEQSMKEIQFYVDFFKKRTFLKRKRIDVTTEPRSMRYNWDVNHIQWIDDKTVAVYSADKTNVVCVSMDD